ncbi:CobW family GTP-binding protein [Hoeflea prorocentri]|uniref:GTP-binding protein n=1 Tax=Hoeflea prorocentri TaxID=1922333 RepID=A0A9X3UKC2_9HYPH|nr:GTP-binding protein [Hoeflea prorocentri]MCY6382166.1 GTP-binding protein [Hoeflea prorocentri]MDA5399966.1 GTP-binding protein [Hoeflea prorocentri]
MTAEPDRAVPVVTVGGFLGAGKTTLVNGLLAQSNGRRIVVFVNDFGAINIDYDLIETVEEDRISLKNGCVCCTLNDDLVGAVVDYCRAAESPDAFVIEASGVADPRSLDQSILALQAAGHVRLDNRIYVLDADCFGRLDYADTELLIDHAVASDLVLVNKADLTTAEKLAALRKMLVRSSPHNKMIETRHCALPFDILIGDGQRDKAVPVPVAPNQLLGHEFHSWSTTSATPINRRRFAAFLKTLAGSTLRAKGRLFFDDAPDRAVLFDFVGSRETRRLLSEKTADPVSVLVAIGHQDRFDAALIAQAFSATLNPVPPEGGRTEERIDNPAF